MPCYTEPPKISHNEWLEIMLCRSFKMLPVEKIKSIPNVDIYVTAINWYASHLYSDFREAWKAQDHDAMKDYEKELNRIGSEIYWEGKLPALRRLRSID